MHLQINAIEVWWSAVSTLLMFLCFWPDSVAIKQQKWCNTGRKHHKILDVCIEILHIMLSKRHSRENLVSNISIILRKKLACPVSVFLTVTEISCQTFYFLGYITVSRLETRSRCLYLCMCVHTLRQNNPSYLFTWGVIIML